MHFRLPEAECPVTMKTLLSTYFMLLAVVGAMLKDDIYEKGKEGNTAVIQCPYAAGYETYLKYFCKGIYKDCKTLIKSDSKEPWMFKGRLSLHDNTEKTMFVVTIDNLSMEDAGRYGCGIERTGQDPFTVVHLTVIKGRPLPTVAKKAGSATENKEKPTQPASPQSPSGKPTPAVTNGAGSATENKEKPTQPTSPQLLSGIFSYVGGAFGAVLLVLSVTFGLKCRARTAGTTQPNSTKNTEDVRLYEEIQHSDPTEGNASVSVGQTPGTTPRLNPHPACKTIYSTITNQKQESYPSNTLPTNHVALTDLATSSSTRLHSQTAESSKEPNYCQASFIKDADLSPSVGHNDKYSTVQKVLNNQSPIYSVIVAPKAPNDSNSDYTNVVLP